MHIFVTGTGTDVGKTIVCSWLCLHSGYDYFKPVQTGSSEGTDSATLKALAGVRIHPESYLYSRPLSPHLAAQLEGDVIDEMTIQVPTADRLIIEGAGGLLVPVNPKKLMIDLIQNMRAPVILVAGSGLGTINHTLLSLQALRGKNIPVLGVIVNGATNRENCAAIAYYGGVDILAEFPKLAKVTQAALQNIPLTDPLKKILE